MRERDIPVLEQSDLPVVDAFAIGLNDETATVLAYLLLRAESPEAPTAATRPEIRLGTGLGRDATIEATNDLVAAELLNTEQVARNLYGRQRKAWAVAGDRSWLETRVRSRHAASLLTQAEAIRADRGAESPMAGARRAGCDTRELCVALNWDPNLIHFPFLVAQDTGAYSAMELTVDFVSQQGSGAAVEAIVSGSAEIGVVGPATLARHLTTHSDVVPIALPYQRSMVVLYTIRDVFGAEFTSIDQLRGSTIAMAPNTETGLIAKLFLSHANVLEDVAIESMASEERTALIEEAADVAVGVFTDTIDLENAGYTVDGLHVAESFPIPGPALVTSPEMLATNRSVLTEFLAATMNGWTTGVQTPMTVHAAIPHEYDSIEPRLERLVTEFGSSPAVETNGWGWQTTEQWQRISTALKQAGLGAND